MFIELLLLINDIKLITTNNHHYNGYETIFHYLTNNFCKTSQSLSSSQLIVIENSPTNVTFSIARFLISNNCLNFAHFTHLNSHMTPKLFVQNTQNFQFVFNYVSYSKLSQLEFIVLLNDLAAMQTQMCQKNCKSYICVFSQHSYKRLKLWAKDQLTILPKKFSIVLVFVKVLTNKQTLNNKSFTTIHINPTLDGCAKEKQLFIPKTMFDFDRLKTHFSKCNLHNMTLTISVNHVINLNIFSFAKFLNFLTTFI